MESNKLIGEFMGFTVIPNGEIKHLPQDNVKWESDLLYSSSWDWLMCVIKRIKKLMGEDNPHFEQWLNPYANTFEQTYKSVVEIIKAYNHRNK